jgi:hypothetical protein
VSLQALMYRARELNRMSEATYRYAMMLQLGWRTSEPLPIAGHEDVLILPRSLELFETAWL